MEEFSVEKEEIMDYFYQERGPAESIAAGIVESDTWPKLGLSSLLSIENLNTNASVSLCWAWVLERHDKVGQSKGSIFHHGHRSKDYQFEGEEIYEVESPGKQR